MGTDVVLNFSSLRAQLENEKNSLHKIDESIKKIVQTSGRYTNDRFNNSSHDTSRSGPRIGGRNTSFQDVANNYKTEDLSGKRKHETKTVFSRLSARAADASDGEGEGEGGWGETGKRPRVSSAVTRELPTRQQVVRAQCTDEQSKVRNRRMFGSLLGTLHKFKQEEIVLKTKEEKKAQVERKIEEAARREREEQVRWRRELFARREHKKASIKALEAKLARVTEFERWETGQRALNNFILSRTRPHLYWLPKRMHPATAEKLASSQKHHERFMAKRRLELDEELQQIEQRCLRAGANAGANNGSAPEVAKENGPADAAHSPNKRNKFASDDAAPVKEEPSDAEGEAEVPLQNGSDTPAHSQPLEETLNDESKLDQSEPRLEEEESEAMEPAASPAGGTDELADTSRSPEHQ